MKHLGSLESTCSRLRLEQLLRMFHALETSSVLHISSTARWRMNQLLIVSLGRCRRSSCEIRAGSSSVAHRQRAFKIRAWIQVFNFLSFKNSRNRWIVENEWAQWINFHMPCKYCLHAFHIANFTCILSFHMHIISHPVCWKLVFKMYINERQKGNRPLRYEGSLLQN